MDINKKKELEYTVRAWGGLKDNVKFLDARQPYIPLDKAYGVDTAVIRKVYNIKNIIKDRLMDIAKKEGELAVYTEQLKKLESEYNNKSIVKFDLDNEKILIKALYNISRTQLTKIENLCTVALQDILQDTSIKFKIRMVETKRGVDTYFYTVSTDGENDIMQSEAGGTKNILSVCLRLIFSEFCTPKIEGPIILDEVGANISAEYQNNFAEFLRQFSEKNNRQIILISHIQAVHEKAPQLITVYKNGKSNVSYIGGN